MIYIFAKIFIVPILWLLWRPLVYGQDNLRIRGKAIFVANHISMTDPILVAMITPRIVHFMAKKELFTGRLKNFFFRQLFAFPVNRKGMDIASVKNALTLLEKDKIFGIFPEGTRSVTYELDELERGTAFLAIRSGAPIVPIYIYPKSYRRFHPIVMVGKPLDVNAIVADTPKAVLVDVVTNEISNAINALRAELEKRL